MPPVLSSARPRGRMPRIAGALALAAVLTAGCAGTGGQAASGTGATSSALVVAAAALPSTFAFDAGNPAGYENLEFAVNTQATLVRNPYLPSQEQGTQSQDFSKFEGVLAERYDTSADGLTYTFHLRQGVVSPAGNELSADDVVYSWQRKFKAATSITAGVQAPVVTDPDTQIKKIDKYTVSFTVAKPGYGFTLLGLLANISGEVYDSAVLKQHDTPDDPYGVKWSQDNPNFGFGAYTRQSYTPGEEMVLVSNPRYVLGEPAIKQVTYRVAADPGTRVNSLKSGDADVAVQLRPADQKDVAGSQTDRVITFPATNMLTMMTINTKNPDLAIPGVRQALAYAVPYDQIVDQVYQGRAIRTTGFLNPTTPNYDNSTYPKYTYDPAKAKQLLAAAGRPNGVKLRIVVSNAVPDVQETAIQLKSAAADAGFDITIDEQPPAKFGQTQASGEFDAFVWRDFAVTQSPQYELGLFFRPGVALNFGKWDDPSFMKALAAGEQYPDPFGTQAHQNFSTAEKIAVDQAPFVWIARVQPSNAFSDSITGYANRSDNTIDYSVLTKAS